MSFADYNKLHAQQMTRRVIGEKFTPTPGFKQGAALAYEETRALELLNSNVYNVHKYQGPMRDELRTLKSTGKLSPEEWGQFVTVNRRSRKTIDWEGLGNYANEKLGTDFDFSEETLNAKIRADAEARAQQMSKMGAPGYVGAFMGTMGAYLNPTESFVNTAMLAVPVGGQFRVAGSVFSTAAKIAGREALVGVAEESLNQAQVYSYKKRIGMEYNISDAALNLLVAAVASGGIGGVGGAIGVRSANRADALARAKQQAWDEAEISDYIAAREVLVEELEKRQQELTGKVVPNLAEMKFTPAARTARALSEQQITAELTEQLFEQAAVKIPRGEVKRLRKEIETLKQQRRAVSVSPDDITVSKRLNKRQAKKEAQKQARIAERQQKAELDTRIQQIEDTLEANEVSRRAEADLSRIRAGKTPEVVRERIVELPEVEAGFSFARQPMLPRDQKALSAHEDQLLNISRDQLAMLKKLPKGTSAKEAARRLDEIEANIRKTTDPGVAAEARTAVARDMEGKPVDMEADYKSKLDDHVVALDEDGKEVTAAEAMAKIDAEREETFKRYDQVAECLRG